MEKLKDYNTGLKNVNKRPINDGVYSISPKILPDSVFSIEQKEYYPIALFIESSTRNANQFFFIKYNESEDYYTITSLHTHQILGIEKIEDSKYMNSFIGPFQAEENILYKWKIEQNEKDFFRFELKGTNLNLSYETRFPLVLLRTKSYDDCQQFAVNRIEIIETGYYCINSKRFNDSYITFKKKSDGIVSSRINNENNQIFWVLFDQNDGCYSIINMNNFHCTSSSQKSITQNDNFGSDSQKWIIGSYNLSNKEFFIESKSNLHRLTIGKVLWSYKLNPFKPENPENPNQIFYFQHSNINSIPDHTRNELLRKIQFRYMKTINLSECKFSQNEKDLILFFENCFNLEELVIPNSIVNIPKNAFANCTRIKQIACDPKWLPLLPNHKNVEVIITLEGVKTKEIEYFKGFTNLKFLELSEKFKIDDCNDDIFKDILDLKTFSGDPIFMKLINKSSLEIVSIPNFVTEIPENAFSGCHFLRQVVFLEKSNLKIIKSGAFTNCRSLKTIEFPISLENVSPDAFDGCDITFNFSNDKQRNTMKSFLKFEGTEITKDIEKYCNISSLEIPLSVNKCEQDALKNFKNLNEVICDPKWLNYFDTSQILQVEIQNGVTDIHKEDFSQLVNLTNLIVPPSVIQIEENSFSQCKELICITCTTNHLKCFNEKQIKMISIIDNVARINGNYFSRYTNLELLYLPDSIKIVSPYAFIN